jgi:FecR protein.
MFSGPIKRKIVCLALAVTFPMSVMLGETKAAMAMASGPAVLNGATLTRSTTIFAGDKLETGANSAVTINVSGSTVLIGANSRVHYFGDTLALHLGSMQVNTSKGMKLQTDSVTVEPNKEIAKYRVDRSTDTVQIASLTGELRVNNGGEVAVLPPGGSLTLKEQDDDQTASPVKGPSNGKIFVVSAIAVGGAAGILWLAHDEKKPLSNQIP